MLAVVESETDLQVASSVLDQIDSSGAEQISSFGVPGASCASLVQQQHVQGKEDSVQGSQITESVSELEPGDWRSPIVNYLKNPSQTRDRKIRRQALKYTLLNDELYRQTIDGLLLKCLSSNQSRIAIGEVHEVFRTIDGTLRYLLTYIWPMVHRCL
jgi:hypothetical protein